MYSLKEYSFSSVEDVYDFLSRLGFIYEKKEKDEELLHHYIDFLRLIDKIDNNEFIILYHDAKIGRHSSKHTKTASDIGDICAKIMKINKNEFDEGLLGNVEDVVKINKQEWLEYINKKYKNKIIVSEPIKKKEQIDTINRNTSSEKTVKNKIELTQEQLQQKEKDLSGLYEYLDDIENRLDTLSKSDKKGTDEYKKLTNIKIQVQKDINIIRKSYGEALGNQNKMGRRGFVSYDSENPNYQHIVSTHENYLSNLKDEQIYELKKEEKIKEVKNIAKKILTNRQYIIFEFYYFNGLTQQEIADLMGLDQRNITNDLKIIINKIKKNLDNYMYFK